MRAIVRKWSSEDELQESVGSLLPYVGRGDGAHIT